MTTSAIVMCAVCFTGADASMRGSLNAGIAVLLGITAVVLACFAAFFVRLASGSRRAPHLVIPNDEGTAGADE